MRADIGSDTIHLHIRYGSFQRLIFQRYFPEVNAIFPKEFFQTVLVPEVFGIAHLIAIGKRQSIFPRSNQNKMDMDISMNTKTVTLDKAAWTAT